MATRTTKKDVQVFANLYRSRLIELGFLPEDAWLVLQPGQPQDGIAWRLFLKNPENGGQSHAPGTPSGLFETGYLGSTAREALDQIATMLRMLDLFELRRNAEDEVVEKLLSNLNAIGREKLGFEKEVEA